MTSPTAAFYVQENCCVADVGHLDAMEYTALMTPAELDVKRLMVKRWILPQSSNTPIAAPFLGNAKVLLKLAQDWAPLKGDFVLEHEEAFPGDGLDLLALPMILSEPTCESLKKLDEQCKTTFRDNVMEKKKLLSWRPMVRGTYAVMYLALSTAELASRIQVIDADGVKHKGYGIEFLLSHIGDLCKLGDWMCMPLIAEPHIIRTDYDDEKRNSKLITVIHDIVFVRNAAKRKRFEMPDAEVDEIIAQSSLKRLRGKCV